MFALIFALAVSAVPASAQSQATTGVIEGIVHDQNGAVIVDAVVTVKHRETGLERSVRTDDNGRYRALLLPLGSYMLEVQKAGFTRLMRENIELAVGQTVSLQLTLQPAGSTEVITVTAEAPVVETGRIEQSTLVDKRSVRTFQSTAATSLGSSSWRLPSPSSRGRTAPRSPSTGRKEFRIMSRWMAPTQITHSSASNEEDSALNSPSRSKPSRSFRWSPTAVRRSLAARAEGSST
jgi:hypothetical protein